ncbi:uncharacterized protein N7484_008647 [Penicillium longicatenatum]|uniref:uncharacterized protein n=1 Tax=Penicillium longicatenatum TaxID=1561947 RepID=UPI00254766AD|nr:uncharacterized protein N7484_008647 [Penicillium longicatenatum]KAJ5635334.1 hypothetical protein N7484_008647 [Penicillium longicatenatum]
MKGFIHRIFKKPRVETYGLDHAVLNIQLPPQTMWMNMGYWESTSDFPEACRALLDQVLAAGLLKSQSKSVRLLDVGCGCGDQSLYLTVLHKDFVTKQPAPGGGSGSAFQATPTSSLPQSRSQHDHIPLIDTYIGITLEPSQAALAKSRLQQKQQVSSQSTKIFCADAANPASWSGELQTSVKALSTVSHDSNTETWLLALDTIYHFRPSRWPIIRFAHDTLQASYMAFDLVLADDVSFFQALLLRIVCWVLGAPFGNIVTQEEYKGLLVGVGYEPSQIEMRDISDHVFGGLSKFLGRRIKEAEPFGLKMGKYRGARVVFDWWARSRIIRGYVVVARRS